MNFLNLKKLFKLIIRKINYKITNIKESRWIKKDANRLSKDEKVLIVDLGANLGQSYKLFRKYFKFKNVKFELFEPNPFCCNELKKLPEIVSGKVKLYNSGAGLKSGHTNFYGLNDNEGGKFSQGGSIVEHHNSHWYKSTKSKSIRVNIINFSNYLISKSKKFNRILVKMDIEGAEVSLLENLISKGTIKKIDVLYLEFHSKYQKSRLSKKTRIRELKILDKLKNINKLKLRLWH